MLVAVVYGERSLVINKTSTENRDIQGVREKRHVRRSEVIKQQVDCGLNTKTCCGIEGTTANTIAAGNLAIVVTVPG